MPARALGSHEVRRDHRLAVPRRERVQRPPTQRGEHQQEQRGLARGSVLEDAGEPVAATAASRHGVAAAQARRDERRVALAHRAASLCADRAGAATPTPDSCAVRGSGPRRRRSNARPCPCRDARRAPCSPGDPDTCRRAPPRRRRRSPEPAGGSRCAWCSGRPAPGADDSSAGPASRRTARRPSTVTASPRATSSRAPRSVCDRGWRRAWKVGISAMSRMNRSSTASAVTATCVRWLIVKFPSGCAAALPAGSADAAMARITRAARRVHVRSRSALRARGAQTAEKRGVARTALRR